MYQPSRPFEQRIEHPYADQFGNYWAWRFADALEALAATAGPGELGRRILTVHETLTTGGQEGLASAWRAFVARTIDDFTADSTPHLTGHPDGPGADLPSFTSSLPQPPDRPLLRDAQSRLPEDLPPAADVLVPPGWVSDPAGDFDGIDVDVVYDPARHEVVYPPTGDSTRKAQMEAAGWEAVATGRHRTAWVREHAAATRRALARLDTTGENPASGHATDATRPARADARGGRPDYQAGQAVRWKQRGRNWRYGHLGDPPVDRHGSLRVFEEGSGSARTLRPTGVERQVRGPRGGRKWVPCDPAAWRIVVTLYERAGVEQVEGHDRPVEVFRQIRGPIADHPDRSTDLTAGAVSRALAYADTHNEVLAHHGDDGTRAELVRITMVSHDAEIWLGWDGDRKRWVRQEDPRTAEAGAPEAVLDPGGKPDPLTLRDEVRRRPAAGRAEAGMVTL